ncbi:energy-coupled thiamine transporter ThiT [Clostridia bacterium]|nr:energy-coupled thiamine transporter ThiT [Clostridia bacterium]
MKNVRTLVEAGLMIALAQVLSYVTIITMPQGGSVTAGSMVPILFFALRRGWKQGMLAGAVYGTLQFILGPKYSFHIISLLFDYGVAFAALGLAGVVRPTSRVKIAIGTAIGVLGRFACHFVSGVVIWSTYAEGTNPYVYSLIYNGSYLLPEMIVSAIILMLIYLPVSQKIDQRA